MTKAQKQLKALQWIPGLTGGMIVSSALHGEQQRPAEQRKGFRRGSVTSALVSGSGSGDGVGETLKAAITDSDQ